MEIIRIYDEKNYTDDMKILERFGVRALIQRNGLFAMQRGKTGEYKIPGGGMDEGETIVQALAREVLEETGLVIKPESMKELGEITEIRRDIFSPDTKYISHSIFYLCEVTEERRPITPTASEIQKGYQAVWASAEEICETNDRLSKDPWIKRDTAFVKMLLENKLDI